MPSTMTRTRRARAKIGASVKAHAERRRRQANRRTHPEPPRAPRHTGRLPVRKARALVANMPNSLARAHVGDDDGGLRMYLQQGLKAVYLGPVFSRDKRGLKNVLTLVRAYNAANQDAWVNDDGVPRGDWAKPHGFYKKWKPRKSRKRGTDAPPKRTVRRSNK